MTLMRILAPALVLLTAACASGRTPNDVATEKSQRQQDRATERVESRVDEETDKRVDSVLDKAFDKIFN